MLEKEQATASSPPEARNSCRRSAAAASCWPTPASCSSGSCQTPGSLNVRHVTQRGAIPSLLQIFRASYMYKRTPHHTPLRRGGGGGGGGSHGRLGLDGSSKCAARFMSDRENVYGSFPLPEAGTTSQRGSWQRAARRSNTLRERAPVAPRTLRAVHDVILRRICVRPIRRPRNCTR